MNKTSQKIKRLQLAHQLFSELLREGIDYPSDVEIELDDCLFNCENQIANLQGKISQSSINEALIDYLEIDKSYFEKRYEIEFYNGADGKRGKLIFDKKQSLDLSGIQNDMFLKLYNVLKDTWDTSLPRDIGWVSYDDFRNSVNRWKKKLNKNPDFEVADPRISTEIDRINKKFVKIIGCKLIENGKPFLMEKHYRLRINTGHIDMPD